MEKQEKIMKGGKKKKKNKQAETKFRHRLTLHFNIIIHDFHYFDRVFCCLYLQCTNALLWSWNISSLAVALVFQICHHFSVQRPNISKKQRGAQQPRTPVVEANMLSVWKLLIWLVRTVPEATQLASGARRTVALRGTLLINWVWSKWHETEPRINQHCTPATRVRDSNMS